MAELSYDKLDQWINDYITRINAYVVSINPNIVIRSNIEINTLLTDKETFIQIIDAYKNIIDKHITNQADNTDKVTKIKYLNEIIDHLMVIHDGTVPTSDKIRMVKEIFYFFDEIAFYIEMKQVSNVDSAITLKVINDFIQSFKQLIKPTVDKQFKVMIKEVNIRIEELTKIYNEHINKRLKATSKPSIGEIIEEMIADIDDDTKNEIFHFRTNSLDNYIIENLENRKAPFMVDKKLIADDIYSQYFPEVFKTFETKNEDTYKDIFMNEDIKTFLYDYLLENPAKVLYLEKDFKDLKLDPQKLNDLNLIYKILELIKPNASNQEAIQFKPIVPIGISSLDRLEKFKIKKRNKERVFLDEDQLFYAHKDRYIACVYKNENHTYHLMEDNLFNDIENNMNISRFKVSKLFKSILSLQVNGNDIIKCSVFKKSERKKQGSIVTDLSIDLFGNDNERIIELFLDNGNRIIDLSEQTTFLQEIKQDSAVYYFYEKDNPSILEYIMTKNEYNEKRKDSNVKVLPRNMTKNYPTIETRTIKSFIDAKNLVSYEDYIEPEFSMKDKLHYQQESKTGEAEDEINRSQGPDGTNPVNDEIFKKHLEYSELAESVKENTIQENIDNKQLQELPIYFMVSAVRSGAIQAGIHSSLLILHKSNMYSVGFGFSDQATHGIKHMIENLNGSLYTPDYLIPSNVLGSSDFNRQNPYATKAYKYKISDYGIFTKEMYDRLTNILKDVNYKESFFTGMVGAAMLMTPKLRYCELSRGTTGTSNCSNFVLNIIGPSRVTCDIRLLPGIPNMISGLSIDAPNFCIRRNLRFFSPSQAVIEMFKYYNNNNNDEPFKRFIKLCHMDEGGIVDIAAKYGSPFLATYKLLSRKKGVLGGKKRKKRTKKKNNL